MEAAMENTQRDEAYREVRNAWIERYPDGKVLTDVQIYSLLNDYANDYEFIQEAINTLPNVQADGYPVNYRMLQNYCRKGIGNKKKKHSQQPVIIGYEEDKNGNLTARGQHRKMMDNEWHVPVIEGFNPRNAEHLKIQADYLFRTGQIGESQYEMIMKGIPIVTGDVDLEEKLHVVMNVQSDLESDIPF